MRVSAEWIGKNQSNESVTSSTCIVEVTESGAVVGKATAVFHFTFEIKALDTTRYAGDTSRGWRKVRIEPGRREFSLPQALRVGGFSYEVALTTMMLIGGCSQGPDSPFAMETAVEKGFKRGNGQLKRKFSRIKT